MYMFPLILDSIGRVHIIFHNCKLLVAAGVAQETDVKKDLH